MADRLTEIEDAIARGTFDGNPHKTALEELVAEVKRLHAEVELKHEALIVADNAMDAYALSDEDTERFAAGLRPAPDDGSGPESEDHEEPRAEVTVSARRNRKCLWKPLTLPSLYCLSRGTGPAD